MRASAAHRPAPKRSKAPPAKALSERREKQLERALQDEYDRAAFGIFTEGTPTRYRLRFVATAAPRVSERRWHPTQVLEPQPDGGVVLTFTCDESPEVEAWVASWRTSVEVLAPAKLRDALGDYGRWLARQYRGAPKA